MPEIDSGCVWPPLLGRGLVREALRGAGIQDHHVVGDEVVLTLRGWRLHSPEQFAAHDTAHAALVRWAQAHAALTGLLSPQRCVFAIADGDGFRVWQLVQSHESLWQRLAMLEHADQADVAAHVEELCAVCARVETTWSAAPYVLPCTLETISASDGSFVGLLPTPERLAANTAPPPRRDRLVEQLHRRLRPEP